MPLLQSPLKICHKYTLKIIQSVRADADNYTSHVHVFVITFAGDKAEGYGVITKRQTCSWPGKDYWTELTTYLRIWLTFLVDTFRKLN